MMSFLIISTKKHDGISSELFCVCNLVGQLDQSDFNSDISHIHLAKIQPEVFSVRFHNQATSF